MKNTKNFVSKKDLFKIHIQSHNYYTNIRLNQLLMTKYLLKE